MPVKKKALTVTPSCFPVVYIVNSLLFTFRLQNIITDMYLRNWNPHLSIDFPFFSVESDGNRRQWLFPSKNHRSTEFSSYLIHWHNSFRSYNLLLSIVNVNDVCNRFYVVHETVKQFKKIVSFSSIGQDKCFYRELSLSRVSTHFHARRTSRIN